MEKIIKDTQNIILENCWMDTMFALQYVAEMQGHNELARELENIAVNYVPEVRD